MKRNVSGTGIRKHTNQIIDGLHHQVHVNGCCNTVLTQRLTHHGTNR